VVILSPKNLKLGEIWRSDFEITRNRPKFGSVSAFGDFSSKTKRLGEVVFCVLEVGQRIREFVVDRY
jgi:hypothetical protein